MRVAFWNWWREKRFYLLPSIMIDLHFKNFEMYWLCFEIDIDLEGI